MTPAPYLFSDMYWLLIIHKYIFEVFTYYLQQNLFFNTREDKYFWHL